MNPTQVSDSEPESSAPSAQALRFEPRAHTVMVARILAGALALPFLATFVIGTRGVLSLVFLLLAVCGGWLMLHVQRRAAARATSVTVDAGRLVVQRPDGARTLEWRDVTELRSDFSRGLVSFGKRARPDAVTIDADVHDLRGFLEAATQHVQAARAGDDASTPRTGRSLFRRSLHEDMITLGIAAAGIVLGLLVGPALFVITALALPRLLWHWSTAPHSVAIDATAVWIVRPFARVVIPLRAITAAGFGVAGRLPGPAVTIEHRDRGTIVIAGLNAAALPLFDAITTALARDRAAQRAGPAARHSGAARQVAGSRQSALLTTAAGALALIGTAWLTVLTGIPLRTATQHGSAMVVRGALLLGAPLESADGDGFTALHHASAGSEIGITRALLNRGARTATRSALGLTPLHIAAERGHEEVVGLLIGAGADVNARTGAGLTSLAHAARAPDTRAAAVARMLLDAGADPNVADDEGRAALHHAALVGAADLIRLLARAGGGVDASDTLRHAPLHLAVIAKQTAAVEALLQAGASVNARGGGGRTALVLAAQEGAPAALVASLLDAGARAGAAADDGWNAVQLATRANNIEMLELFARRLAPLDATDGRVAPALWLAAEAGNIDAARALLRGGASPRLRWQGRSPLELARSKNSGTMVALMRMR
jgi:ankyrin repeat protein